VNKRNWYIEAEEQMRNDMIAEGERLMFTAQKGSYLDRVWNGGVRCHATGRLRPKLLDHFPESDLYFCEGDEIWQKYVHKDEVLWCFYAYAVGEPIKE